MKCANAIPFAVATALLLSTVDLQAQDVVVTPGFVSGSVQIGTEQIRRLFVTASGPGGLSSQATINVPVPGQNVVNYTLTVDVPVGTTPTYFVRMFVDTDDFRDDFTFPLEPAVVTEGQTTPLDFLISDPGFVEGTITVTGGGLLSFIDISAVSLTNPSFNAKTVFGATGTTVDYQVPVRPDSQVRCSGNVRLTNGARINVTNQIVSVDPGQTVRCDYTVETPQIGDITGTINHSGAFVPDRYNIQANGTTNRTISQFPPFAGPGNETTYSFPDLPVDTYGLRNSSTFAQYNADDDRFRFPTSAFAPSSTATVTPGGNTVVDIAACQAYLNGVLTIAGSASLDDLRGIESTITANGSGVASGASARDRYDRATGAYDLILSEGDWRPQSTTLFFRRNSPDPTAFLNENITIIDRDAIANPIPLACGQTAVRDQQIAFGSVTVNFSVAGGGVLTNPRLQGNCQLVEAGNTVFTSNFNSTTSGQIDVEQGVVKFLSHGGTCTVTAQATVNGSLVTFSRFDVTVTPGMDQEVDIGGPTVSVAYPEPGITIDANSITVTGTATDDVEVATVFVNGVEATLVSTGNSGDPAEVAFSATIPLPNKGPVQIVTVATDTSGKTGSDTRTIFNDAAPPEVTFTPPDGAIFNLPTTSTIVEGTVSDDAGVASVTVNGQVVTTVPAGPGAVTFSTTIPLALGDNSITVVATDISEKSTTVTHIVTLVENQPPTVTLSGPTEVSEGAAPAYTFAVADADDTAYTLLSVTCGAAGTIGDLVSNGAIPGGGSFSCSFPDGPAACVVSVEVADAFGATAMATLAVNVLNVAPSPAIQTLSAGSINEGQGVAIEVVFTDSGALDSHTAAIRWGDGTATEVVSVAAGARVFTASHLYADDNPTATASDVNAISVSVTDSDSATGSAAANVTVNNLAPEITGVTGGLNPVAVGTTVALSAAFQDAGVQDTHVCTVDWDDPAASGSEAGAVTAGSCDASHTFTAAGLNFHSTSYDWLVVAGARAQFKGLGELNGAFGSDGVSGYSFLLTGVDGQANGGGGTDKFRMKIVDKATDTLVYDSGLGAGDDIDNDGPMLPLSGGSITIHNNGGGN